MQGIYLIVFQVFIILFFGIFVRTSPDDTSLTTYSTTIISGFYFLLAYTATSFKFKMFDWTMLTNMLFILIICLQLNTLFTMFWMSCFDGFSATSSFTSVHVIVGIQAALAIMITCFEFIGQINKPQIFLVAIIQVFAFALNWVIQFKGKFKRYSGITSMTGGSVMTSFLFGYAFSLPIRKLKYNQTPGFLQQKEKYFTLTLKLIGLIILIFLWPSYNMMTSIPDLLISNIISTSLLLQQAYLQTFLCLLSAVITTLAVRIYGEKININQFINSIINTGILIGASVEVIIDPFASVLIGVAGPILYLLYEKYLSPLHMKGYPFDKIIMCLLGATFNSIFVAGRTGRTPALAYDYSKQAGFQFLNFVLSFLFAVLFGFLAAFLLKTINTLNDQTSNKDSSIWLIQQQVIPLYSDDPLILQLHEKQVQKKLRKQQQVFNLKQSFIAQKVRQNGELGKILKQQIQYQSRIK